MSVSLLVFLLANYFLPAVIYSLIIVLLLQKNYPLALRALTALFLAWVLGWFLKHFFYIPRPFIFSGRLPLFTLPQDGSFPSNHAASVFAVSFTLFPSHRKLGFNLLIASLIVAVSRVVYDFHSWADVSGGLLLGLLSSWISRRLIHR